MLQDIVKIFIGNLISALCIAGRKIQRFYLFQHYKTGNFFTFLQFNMQRVIFSLRSDWTDYRETLIRTSFLLLAA